MIAGTVELLIGQGIVKILEEKKWRAQQELNLQPLVPLTNDSPFYSFSLALPGWNGFSGTNQLNGALSDTIALDATVIGIFDRNTTPSYNGSAVIQGNYTAFLEAALSYRLPPAGPANATLSQTGLVPIGTKSLSFLAEAYGPFQVSLGGVALNLISSPVPGQAYNLFQADISAFAGQTNELDFTVFAQNPYNNSPNVLLLDDIQFSPQAIPEPTALGLIMMAATGLGLWRLVSRKTR